jgi:hypothetical protein
VETWGGGVPSLSHTDYRYLLLALKISLDLDSDSGGAAFVLPTYIYQGTKLWCSREYVRILVIAKNSIESSPAATGHVPVHLLPMLSEFPVSQRLKFCHNRGCLHGTIFGLFHQPSSSVCLASAILLAVFVYIAVFRLLAIPALV